MLYGSISSRDHAPNANQSTPGIFTSETAETPMEVVMDAPDAPKAVAAPSACVMKLETRPMPMPMAPEPSVAPAPEPSVAPAAEPSVAPAPKPSVAPAPEPSVAPATEPATEPAVAPAVAPAAKAVSTVTTAPVKAPMATDVDGSSFFSSLVIQTITPQTFETSMACLVEASKDTIRYCLPNDDGSCATEYDSMNPNCHEASFTVLAPISQKSLRRMW